MYYKTGPKQQDKPVKEFILKLYMVCNPDPERQCYSHFTTATGVFNIHRCEPFVVRPYRALLIFPCAVFIHVIMAKIVAFLYCAIALMIFL